MEKIINFKKTPNNLNYIKFQDTLIFFNLDNINITS